VIDLSKIKSVYFIGIGGIGMSAIARYFNSIGINVSGYDKTQTLLTEELVQEGMKIHYEDDLRLLPDQIDLVVYTPAIPADHIELNYLREKKFPVLKRSEVLEIITHEKFTIAVAGSHGKTTISTMIAHVLKNSGYDCTAFLGGISLNYNSNFILGKNQVVVVEADEYDRSFHRLQPDIAVISAVDTDHLDIYGSQKNIEDAFVEFTRKLKPGGSLVVNSHIPILKNLTGKVYTYSLNNTLAHTHGYDIRIENGTYHFTVRSIDLNYYFYELNVGGLHNVENATAAITVAGMLGIDQQKIAEAIKTFKGSQRRFEYVIKTNDLVFIDDYAHHPREIDALLGSVKQLYSGKKITAIFQPHLFSRTKDLSEEFAKSLSVADEVILLDVYPARELPIEGVTSQIILDKIPHNNKMICSKMDLIERMKSSHFEVVLTIGAGDIDQLVEPVKNALLKA